MNIDSLRKLKRLVAKKKEETQRAHDEQKAKVAGRKKSPPRPHELQSFQLKAGAPATASTVEKWFREALFELHQRRYVVSAWGVKQNTLAKKLLVEFGAELTQKAVNAFVLGWPDLVRGSRGRIQGEPTIQLLYAMRETIFARAQGIDQVSVVDVKNSDEFQDNSDDTPGVGW